MPKIFSNPKAVGLIGAVLLFPIYALTSHIGGENRGFIVFCVTGAFFGVAYVRFDIINNIYFISTMIVLYIIQCTIAMMVDWPYNFPGFLMIPIAIADAFFILYAILFVERFCNSRFH
jgi:hypothetical protein